MRARDVLLKNDVIWVGFEERIQAPWAQTIQGLEEDSTEDNSNLLSEMLRFSDSSTPRSLRLKIDASTCPNHNQFKDQAIKFIDISEHSLLALDEESAKIHKKYNFIVQYYRSPERNVLTGVDLGEFIPHPSTIARFPEFQEACTGWYTVRLHEPLIRPFR
jgi:hypothetical protein